MKKFLVLSLLAFGFLFVASVEQAQAHRRCFRPAYRYRCYTPVYSYSYYTPSYRSCNYSSYGYNNCGSYYQGSTYPSYSCNYYGTYPYATYYGYSPVISVSYTTRSSCYRYGW